MILYFLLLCHRDPKANTNTTQRLHNLRGIRTDDIHPALSLSNHPVQGSFHQPSHNRFSKHESSAFQIQQRIHSTCGRAYVWSNLPLLLLQGDGTHTPNQRE